MKINGNRVHEGTHGYRGYPARNQRRRDARQLRDARRDDAHRRANYWTQENDGPRQRPLIVRVIAQLVACFCLRGR